MSDAHYPDDLRYHDQHDWARLEGDEHAVLGITWYAQDSLGEVVFYDPPEVGATISNEDPYGEGWLIKVRLTSPEEAEALLGASEYRKLLEN